MQKNLEKKFQEEAAGEIITDSIYTAPEDAMYVVLRRFADKDAGYTSLYPVNSATGKVDPSKKWRDDWKTPNPNNQGQFFKLKPVKGIGRPGKFNKEPDAEKYLYYYESIWEFPTGGRGSRYRTMNLEDAFKYEKFFNDQRYGVMLNAMRTNRAGWMAKPMILQKIQNI